jgi:transcriptional regulator with XRE-family HTH domain
MSKDTATRQTGKALSKELVRGMRERAGMTQDELAERLGLAGKAIISGWETGRTTCEGPAAELILHLLGGGGTSRAFGELDELTEATWRRSGNWVDSWRQVSAVPDASIVIERDKFATIFPHASIPHEGHVHGFPFVDYGLPAEVFGISAIGWSGAIPIERNRSPRYAWHLTRTSEFAYRETPWELARDSITKGHTHVGSLLQLALCTTVFLGRLAERAGLDRDVQYELRLDLEGMEGRGVAVALGHWNQCDNPRPISSDNHIHAGIKLPLGKIASEPLASAYALVGELMLLLRPDFSTTSALERQLRARIKSDAEHNLRFLAFADDLLPVP